MNWLSAIISGIISPLTNVASAYLNKKQDVDLEKFKVDGQVDMALITANIALVQATSALLQNRWIVGLQVMFGVPTAAFYAKCLVYDKMLALGHTDPLEGDTATWAMMVVSFLFLHSALMTWNRKT